MCGVNPINLRVRNLLYMKNSSESMLFFSFGLFAWSWWIELSRFQETTCHVISCKSFSEISFIVVWTNVKLSIQFTAGRLPHLIKTRGVCLRNNDIRVTPVNRRTALWVFVEIDSISMSFRDNMKGKFRWFILRYIYVTARYTASLDAALRHVTRIFLDICVMW